MKRNDGLFRLIKSLTKSEKRFFKIYSSRHVIGDQNNYIQLFDAIDKQKIYNEDAINRKFKGHKFVKRLSVAKAYLYELILKSMNRYHAQQTIEAQLRELLGNIYFLQEKGIYDQALRLINKSKKLALEYEKLTFLPEILRLQKSILENQSYTGQKEALLQEIHEENETFLNRLLNINDYWLLHARLFYRHTHQGIIRSQADQSNLAAILEAAILQDETLALTYEAKLLLYKTYSTYYFIIRDFPNCYKYSNELINLLESRPELLKQDSMLYVSSVNNLLNMTGMLKKQEERTHYLQKLSLMMGDKELKKNAQLQLKLFQAYYYHQMIYHISKFTYQEATSLITQLDIELKKYQDKMDTMGEVMLCFYAFHICYGASAYQDATQWLERILVKDPTDIRQDIYRFSKILLLLVTLELNDPARLKQTIRSTYAFLYQQEQLYPFEGMLKNAIRQLTTVPTNTEGFKQWLIHWRNELMILKKQQGQIRAQVYFDFLSWIHAKIIDKPFIQVMAEGAVVDVKSN